MTLYGIRIPGYRIVSLLGLAGCFVALGFALYLQHVVGLDPCPLCILQRVAVFAAMAVLIVAILHNPARTGQRVYAVLGALATLFGLGVAGRHVWLQHMPADQVPACGPGLEYMLDVFPMQDVISMVLRGSGECAVVDWTFLGFSLAELTLAVFVGLLALFAFQLLRRDA
ncbi:MAG: disulfide bond formation protein B [Pseudomonadota bacterium]